MPNWRLRAISILSPSGDFSWKSWSRRTFRQPHPAPRSAPAASTPKPVERNGWFADLVTNHIPAENFPFSTWAKLMRNVLSLEEDELMRSPSAQGRRELQEAIAGHLYHFRGMSVEPEQIVIGAGTEYLYGLLVQFLGRDKLYGVEEPGYQKPGQIYESCGARSVAIPMDDAGVQADALESEGVDVLHISPSHHFPHRHRPARSSRRYELLGWCARRRGAIFWRTTTTASSAPAAGDPYAPEH